MTIEQFRQHMAAGLPVEIAAKTLDMTFKSIRIVGGVLARFIKNV